MVVADIARVIAVAGKDGIEPERIARMSCPGRTFAIQWLYLICTKRASARRKREMVMQFVDDIDAKGGIVWELGSGRRSDDRAQRRAMLADAMEAVTKGRMATMTNSRGRRPQTFDDATRAKAKAAWESRKLKTWDDVRAALPPGVSIWRAYKWFGRRQAQD